jgi:hypothetical protein
MWPLTNLQISSKQFVVCTYSICDSICEVCEINYVFIHVKLEELTFIVCANPVRIPSENVGPLNEEDCLFIH